MVIDAGDTGWLMVGLVLGEKLPPQAIEVGGVRIFPLTKEQVRQVSPIEPRNVRLRFEDESGEEPHQLHVSPHRVTLTSTWGFSVEIPHANRLDDAEEQAQLLVDRARQALTVSLGVPYVFEPRRVIGPDGAASPWAGAAGMAVDVEELDAASSERGGLFARVIEQSQVARSAASYIDRAAALELAMVDMPEGQPGILHSYFMALEGVVGAVVKPVRQELVSATTDERQAIIGDLTAALAEDHPSSKKAQLTREAARALARLDLMFMDLQIAKAAEVLEISPADSELAQQLNHFRNEYLGHYRSAIPGEKMRYWFEERRALTITTNFLRAYMDRQ